MAQKRALEQHIAVFGESGSGKTVLLSSFYGATQEPEFMKNSLFHVVAEDIGQGARLRRNFLGMKNSSQAPAQTRFASVPYAFSVKPRTTGGKKKRTNAQDLRLVWHDYPGEWFEASIDGPEEAKRRVDTFRALLESNVALLLVDGQKLLDHAGEEERYLKSLLGNFRGGLESLRHELLVDGKRLVVFPRVWVVALSKSDLMPELDVFEFRDLLIEKVGDEMDELRRVIASLIEAPEALSVGEDFVLLSAAHFDPGNINVSERVGVDLILPIAATLHLERHLAWARAKQTTAKVAERLIRGLGAFAKALGGIAALLARLRPKSKTMIAIVGLLAQFADDIEDLVHAGGDKLRKIHDAARENGDLLKAMLAGFRIDLENGERDDVLLRAPR
ncbi:MAG: ATP/GTP-binding protein [Microbacteriaceae bacterium]